MPREFRVKPINKGPVRRIRLRAVVAYPAVSVALVAAVALVLAPFGPAQGMALAALATPTETSASIAAPNATATLAPAAGVVIAEHHVLARIEGAEFQARYLPVDAPMLLASQTQTFRVRFQLRNIGAVPVTAIPQLEYRPEGSDDFLAVPEEAQQGIAFQVAREQAWSLTNLAWEQSPLGQDIALGELRIPSDVGAVAVSGHHSMSANPDEPITLPANSYTEQEFTVQLTLDARALTGYELRVTDGGTALTGSPVATIRLGPPPSLPAPASPTPSLPAPATPAPSLPAPATPAPSLPAPAGPTPSLPAPATPTPSPSAPADQVQGVPLDIPTATSDTGAAYPLVKPSVADMSSGVVAPAAAGPNDVLYGLVTSTTSLAAVFRSDIHGPYTTTSDQCGVCHRTHTAKGPNLLTKSSPQSTLCFTCHDGTGANANVSAQFADTAVPQNDNTNRLYYRHDTLNPAKPHTSAGANEFGGVSNRHTECGDCHNPHQANGTNGTTTPPPSTGVTASGRLAGVSGVSVVNSPTPGLAPTYTFLDGKTPATSIQFEYQLCFKCHSGFTTLSPNGSFGPSRYRLDKGVEFNPNNPSYHPIEAPGENTTPAMTASLAGGTTWRLTTGSTIRCVNCHASSTKAPATPTLNQPPANGDLPMHTSRNPGILLAKYRNRVLMSATEPYSAANFALCYMCHSSTPFTDSNSTATNFDQHAKHVSNLDSRRAEGGTPDIDTIGGGRGNAVCAECHFRQHSTNYKVAGQTVPGTRLVSFSTNVSAVSGTLKWTPGTVGSGSCTLTCHTYTHINKSYSPGGW